MKSILVIFVFFISHTITAQLMPLWEFEKHNKNKEDLPYAELNINGKKYKTNWDYFLSKKDTIFKNETQDIVYFTIYKERYLFVSYYPEEQRALSFGFSNRKLTRLDVIDIEDSRRKWYYDFTVLETERNMKLGLSNIAGFNPKAEEIFFMIKFSYDTNSEFIPSPNHSGHIPSY